MEIKKSNKANLERKRIVFFQMGLVMALVFLFLGFEWSRSATDEVSYAMLEEGDLIEEIEIPVTRREIEKRQEELPSLEPEEIKVVDNETELKDTFSIGLDISNVNVTKKFNIEPEPEIVEPKIHVSVQEMPTFMEGDLRTFHKWVQSRVNYPEIPKNMGIEGKVVVSFVVDTDGSLTNMKVVNSIDDIFSEEVLRVLKESPAWKPGKQNGREAKVIFFMPVIFKLRK